MSLYQRKIFVGDTDFSGALYFTRLQDIALESFITQFESFLFDQDYFFPVVRAVADYKSMVKLGDHLTATLFEKRVGHTSFTYLVVLENQKKEEVGCVTITHVCVSKASKDKVEIPVLFKKALALLDRLEVVG